MKFDNIEPAKPTEHPKRTKRKYYNPDTGKYVSYAVAYGIKRRGGPDLFQNQNQVDVLDSDSTEILKERLRCVNLISEVLTNIINE